MQHDPDHDELAQSDRDEDSEMQTLRLHTHRLDLKPLPLEAAAALPEGREEASRALAAQLSPEWPGSHLFGLLRRHASAPAELACFGIWVMIERDDGRVIGDVGFHGPPDEAGTIEIGYSVVPTRQGRGYAAEAARALVRWALSQPSVLCVVAGCDPHNLPSVRTLERVGFYRTGEADGELRWRYANQTEHG